MDSVAANITNAFQGATTARRRALVLPVVLVILLLLALLSASFAFQVQADHAAGRAMSNRLQCRLAAEAGVQKVMYLLRTQRDNPDAWYHNPEEFDQALVWSPVATIDEIGKAASLAGDESNAHALRFSIVADDPTDDEIEVRFGITDEAAKLNINTATETQLMRLISAVVPVETDPKALVDCLLDWRDEDDEPREFGAETEYYQGLDVPYRAKNAAFDTVEELLLVKGFDGQVLYAEDYDRNGLLSDNENDAETSFPIDDGDGLLNRGLYPYVTVYTHEFQVANDNKARIVLFNDAAQIRDDLEEAFDDSGVVDFILNATRPTGTQRTRSLGDYLGPRIINDRLTDSPITGEQAAILFDKCTLNPVPERFGLINVVTAPPLVLQCIEGLPEEAIPLILQKRAELVGPIKSTTAWLVTEKILTPDQYALIQDQVTARARQFTIESIGFSDDAGLYTRLQVIVDMRGPLAQMVYYRDLTKLGLGYPIYGEEGERRFVLEDE